MIIEPSDQTNVSLTTETTKPKQQKIKIHRLNAMKVVLGVLAGLTLLSFMTMDRGSVPLIKATSEFLVNLKYMFLQPKISVNLLQGLSNSLLLTLGLSILTTFIGVFFGFIFAVLSATNLLDRRYTLVARSIMAFIRAVPTILWVLVFSIVCGLGINAAVLGLSLHSIAYLGKAYSDSIEALGTDRLESFKASGVGFWATVCQGVIPSIKPALISWSFIRLEINFANAVAIGAAAGAGGIGYQLFVSSAFDFDFHEVGTIVYLILITAIILEIIAVQIRKQFIDTTQR